MLHILGASMAQVVGALAAFLGVFVRWLIILLRMAPGVVGPVAIVYGVWMYDPRPAVILGGVILWLADLRIEGRK